MSFLVLDSFNHRIDEAQYQMLMTELLVCSNLNLVLWCDRVFLVATKREADLCFVCLKTQARIQDFEMGGEFL